MTGSTGRAPQALATPLIPTPQVQAVLIPLGLILALGWAVITFGAANLHDRYLFFLLLMPAAVATALTVPESWFRRLTGWCLVAVGFFLLAQIALGPTLIARGYTLAAIGWIALVVSLRASQSSQSSQSRQASQSNQAGREARLETLQRESPRRPPGVRILVWGVLLLGAVEAAYGLAQVFGHLETIGAFVRLDSDIATGTYVNRNHYAGFLNLALALGLGALHAKNASHAREPALERYARSWVVIMILALMGLAMVLSRSRGGILTLLLTVGLVSVLLFLRRRRGTRRGLSGLVPAIVVLTILALGLSIGLEAVFERFGQVEEGSEVRMVVYGDTLALIADHPLAGVGPDMYRWRFRPYQTEQLELRYDQAHNDYLQTAAEWGLPLALLFWAFVGWRFFRALFHFFDSRDPQTQGLALGAAAAIFTTLVHSLVDFNLQIPANLATFTLVLGLAWGLDSHRRGASR